MYIIINDYHINSKRAVIVNYQQSMWFPVDKKFVKGRVILILYKVFINDLLNKLERINENVGISRIKLSIPAIVDNIT